MAHPLHHAISSARRFGGVPDDYQPIHDWFDASKEHMAYFTHRGLRHHTQGIFEAERLFGLSLMNSAGRVIPIRWIGEQHVKEDCGGRIPSMSDWLGRIQPESWMATGHIDNEITVIGCDPMAEWVDAVATRQTILGFAEWLEKASTEQHAQSEASQCTASATGPERSRG